MTVRFFDRQEKSNPLNNCGISAKADLLEILDSLRSREPFFCELIGENGYNLLIGIGAAIGCVQYSRTDRKMPYLMAVSVGDPGSEGHVQFLTADTPTPVAARYCIPFDLVKEVAAYFLETGDRIPVLAWEEL